MRTEADDPARTRLFDPLFRRFGELGLLGIRHDPAWGGSGLDYWYVVAYAEELVRSRNGGLGTAMLVQGEMATPIIGDLGDGEPETCEIGHVLISGIREIPSRHLAGAFQEMAHDGALPQSIPVIPAPAELEHQRRQEQRRVGNPPRDDYIGTPLQGLDKGFGAQVGIGGDDPVLKGQQPLSAAIAAQANGGCLCQDARQLPAGG